MRLWRLGPDDAEAWREIRLQALRDAPDAFDSLYADWSCRPLADFAARLAAVPTFAAGECAARPLAVAAWERDLDPRCARRGWLMSVYARPEARGRGFADAVLARIADDARSAGMTSLGLHVGEANGPALRLYRRAGFAPSGVPAFTNPNGIREVELLRPL